ncbi:MAG: methionine--tRNA ligase [Candidatus Ranarchaeia archaeon]
MRYLVTAALIYANGDPHLGHLRSTYLPPDIYTRYRRRRGDKIVFITGTDDHGTPTSMQAEREKVSPKDIVNKYWKRDKETFERFGLTFDHFSQTSTSLHAETTQWFFSQLLKSKKIYEKEILLPYCKTCDRYLADRYLRGTCPYCGYEDARGDECQNCGRALAEGELENPRCYQCKNSAEKKKTTHWFIKLSEAQTWLKDIIKNEKLKLPGIGKAFLLGQYLNKTLRDIAITRDLDWGIPLPDPISKTKKLDKVLYVWFDAPIGYIDGTKEWAKKQKKPDLWKSFWLEKDTVKIHFIGKGILFHHALFWPTLLEGAGYPIPNVVPAYGHITLRGSAMSKEAGLVVDLRDYLKKYPPDSLRYFSTTVAPLKDDTDFTWEEFTRRHNNELTDTLGNFVHRVLTFLEANFSSSIPPIPNKFSKGSKHLLERISKIRQAVESSIETFEIREGLLRIMDLARDGNRYFSETEPWKTIKNDKQQAAEALYVSVQLVFALAQLIEPYLPFTAEKIWNGLGFSNPQQIHKKPWSDIGTFLPPDHKIKKPKPLFTKIELETQEEEKPHDKKEVKVAKPKKDGKKMSSEEITYEQFSALDLRLAKVLAAERVEGTERLLKIQIDIGDEPRQIVAGLGDQYSPDDLVGETIAVIVNLQSRKIRGIESRGMLLAAALGKKASLLKPDKEFPPGSKIM